MYARGSMAKGLCQRCGLKYLLWELVFDGYYPNLRVCNACYDPPQPQERLAVVSDPEALYKPAVDTVYISPPMLTAVLNPDQTVTLNWSGFNGDTSGDIYTGNYLNGPLKSGSANITAGYYVNRSRDGITYEIIATLMNTAGEFGELIVETNTYTDTPPSLGTWFYTVTGFDVEANSEYGA